MARLSSILLALILAGVVLVYQAGCSGRPASARPSATMPAAATTFVIAADDYERAFEVARVELVRRRFDLERVDAQAGVLLTRPENGAGLLAPWTLGPGAQPLEDTLNAQSRTVEIRFEAAEAAAAAPQGRGAALADPRLPVPPGRAAESVIVTVRVLISRRVTPTRRLDPSGIRYSLNASKPELFRRGLGTQYWAPQDLDPPASRQIARVIERRLGLADGRADGPSDGLVAGRRDTVDRPADEGGAALDPQLSVQ